MKRYGRDAIPLYLVFDTRGELLGRIQGAADAETFMDNLRTIIARQKPHKQPPPRPPPPGPPPPPAAR